MFKNGLKSILDDFLLFGWIPVGHKFFWYELATKNIDIWVKNSPIIVYIGTFHALKTIDMNLWSELNSFKCTSFRTAIYLKNDNAASQIIISVDDKCTVFVGKIKVSFL